MGIFELAAELGKALKEDEKLVKLEEAKKAYDESKTIAATKEIAVQVGGKLKTTVTVATDCSDEDIVKAACADEKIQRLMQGMEIVKTIVVKGKLVNLILKPQK